MIRIVSSRILVYKFGERCVATADGMERIVGIVRDALSRGYRLVIVVAAVEGVTDKLLSLCREVELGVEDRVWGYIDWIREMHVKLAMETLNGIEAREAALRRIEEVVEGVKSISYTCLKLREVTAKVRDYIASIGEVLSAIIVSGKLTEGGIDSVALAGWEAGIVTDGRFGDANPLIENTRVEVSRRLKPLIDRDVTPVVAGFSGATIDGCITTLGRGGADYTATILAACLDAEEVYLWTHVDGIMTADPMIEEEARTIDKLSYEEAVELARFSVKGLHPRVFDPIASRGIPVRVRNLFDTSKRGTSIGPGRPEVDRRIVKTVVLIRDLALLAVEGTGMVGLPGVAAKVFEALGRAGVNILMISQSSSEANITMVIDRGSLDRAVAALESSVTGSLVSQVYYEPDICVVSVVGAGMRGTPGVAAKVFKAVASKGINVRMIAQGSSEYNISFVVREVDGEEAVRAIHDEFKLYEE
ncbi:MAG: aspartate kinase [Candidatus Bathyarchaeia archaeon]